MMLLDKTNLIVAFPGIEFMNSVNRTTNNTDYKGIAYEMGEGFKEKGKQFTGQNYIPTCETQYGEETGKRGKGSFY